MRRVTLTLFIIIGAFIAFQIKKKDKVVDFSLGLAFGVIIILLLTHLVPEIVEHLGLGYIYLFLIFGAVGYCALKALDKFIPDHDDDGKGMNKQEQKETEFETKSIEEMKLAIEEKNYVIIGGHINWINKLKSEFPNWTYISVDNFKNFDGTVLDNKEKLFFFTDYISHTAYGKFIKIARERKIPFSYLHGVNMEQIIRQIYESGEK